MINCFIHILQWDLLLLFIGKVCENWVCVLDDVLLLVVFLHGKIRAWHCSKGSGQQEQLLSPYPLLPTPVWGWCWTLLSVYLDCGPHILMLERHAFCWELIIQSSDAVFIISKWNKSVVLSIEFLKDFNLSMTSRMEFKYIFIVPMFFVLWTSITLQTKKHKKLYLSNTEHRTMFRWI